MVYVGLIGSFKYSRSRYFAFLKTSNQDLLVKILKEQRTYIGLLLTHVFADFYCHVVFTYNSKKLRFCLFLCRKTAGIELEGGRYLIHNIYSDEETLKLIEASCDVLGMSFYHHMISLSCNIVARELRAFRF